MGNSTVLRGKRGNLRWRVVMNLPFAVSVSAAECVGSRMLPTVAAVHVY